jgi:hypothetical protein
MPEGTTTIARPGSGGGASKLLRDRRTLYVAGAAVAGIAGYAWWTKGQSADEPPLVFDEFGNPIAGPTPGLTEPTVLDSNLTVTPPSTGVRTNADWTQAATDYLEGRGYNAQAILGALSKFIQRRPLTTTEAEIVGAAVASQGWPPEDRPWTIIMATTTTTDPGAKPPPAPAWVRGAPGRNQAVITWAPVAGATSYEIRRSTGAPGSLTGWVNVGNVTRHVAQAKVRRNTFFSYAVRARNAAGPGPSRATGGIKILGP